MITGWGEEESRDWAAESSHKHLRKLDMAARKALLFDAIRVGAAATTAVTDIVTFEPLLATEAMFGYEGSDLHTAVEGGRRYFYTGAEKDGYFSPLHLAASVGARDVVTLLVREFDADVAERDSRDGTAEERASPEGRKAFYELRGVFFEAHERYAGNTHPTTGQRSGAGVLYAKLEGYESLEKVLYRGTFKDGLYHGQGTLFWPYDGALDAVQYKGRFKGGQKHGRGMLLDVQGHKVYHGTFRADKKDGRGELFESVEDTFTRTYHGEFETDLMHGFGVAYYGSGGTFVGRFEYGLKAGVGVYAYPNGDRFEGMFFNDKPDGKGSYYTPAADVPGESGSHFIWQNGRKATQVDTPFVPDKLDMPDSNEDDLNQNHMLQTLLSDDASVSSVDTAKAKSDKKKMDATTAATARGTATFAAGDNAGGDEAPKPQSANLAFLPDPSGKDWKQQLGKAVRILGKTAATMGMAVPDDGPVGGVSKTKGTKKGSGEQGEEEGGEGGAQDETDLSDEEPDMDDVIASHFLSFPPLLTAYVYSCSASKVFEGRSAPETDTSASLTQTRQQMPMSVPEFDAVNHVVMDAVEDFNERWEKAFAAQKAEEDAAADARKGEEAEEKKAAESSISADATNSPGRTSMASVHEAGLVSQIVSKNVFMTDAEKRKELKRKQRAELLARKAGAALNKDVEAGIGLAVCDALEKELGDLTADDGAGMGGDEGLAPTRSWQAQQRQRKGRQEDLEGADSDGNMDVNTEEALSNEFATELLYLLRLARSVM